MRVAATQQACTGRARLKAGGSRARTECTANTCSMFVTRRRNRLARGGPDARLGARTRAERTKNMLSMVVTLDVSQLEMSALKFFKLAKSEPMLVMAETSQSAIGPYVAMAPVEFESKAWTAVCSSALLVKT